MTGPVPIELIVPGIFACIAALGWMAHRALDRFPGEDE